MSQVQLAEVKNKFSEYVKAVQTGAVFLLIGIYGLRNVKKKTAIALIAV